eukprot:10851050-Prorocentrum_lima.AAC.1
MSERRGDVHKQGGPRGMGVLLKVFPGAKAQKRVLGARAGAKAMLRSDNGGNQFLMSFPEEGAT